MARIYANENMPLPVVLALKELGHDVLTTTDAGKAGIAESDESVLDFSIKEKRILITLNRKHFIRLHKKVPEHYGIIVCSFDINFPWLANKVDKLLQKQLIHGLLLRVNRD